MSESQPSLLVSTGRLSTSPEKLKRELISARRLKAGAETRLVGAENALAYERQHGTRASVIRAECDVANVHRTLDGLTEEIRELEVELAGEWAPASWGAEGRSAAG